MGYMHMKNTGKYIDRIIEVLFYVISCGILCFLIVGYLTFPGEKQENVYDCEKLDVNWYQVLDDGTEKPITVPGKCEVEWGEKLTISGMLPETLDADKTPWLCFHSSLQDMQIFIDGEHRGTYTTESTRLWGENSVSAYYFVRLKNSDRGKTIDFSSITDSKYSGVFREVYCGTALGMYMEFAKSNGVEVIGAFIVLLLSIATIIVCAYMKAKMHRRRLYLAYLGWTELFLSIWILSESPMRQLYFDNISLAGYMTHFAVYFLAIPIILFFDSVQEQRHSKLYRVLVGAEMFFSCVWSVLEITGTASFSVLFYFTMALHAVGMVSIIITLVTDIKSGYAKRYYFVYLGFGGFLIATLLQLAMYVRRTMVFHGVSLCIGEIFWLVMTVISTLRDYFDLERENVENRLKAQNLTWQAMETLVQTIEAKDKYTKGHSTRVAKYASLLAGKMGMQKSEKDKIYNMAMLHDIGKIGIEDRIINKPGKLTEEEYAVIKTHPDIGYQILVNMNEIKDIEYGARWHHERFDGKGYPDGLAGEEIPVYARIIAVADVYDAMTSSRSYRESLPQHEVRAELERVSGSQLDPDVVKCMIQLIDEDPEFHLRQIEE